MAGDAVCKTKQDLENAYGAQSRVQGVYNIVPFKTKKNTIFVHWPVVVLSDKTQVLLESFWKHQQGRSPDERPDLVGKTVEARGRLHREPPTDPAAQNFAIPCLSPVDQLVLLTTEP